MLERYDSAPLDPRFEFLVITFTSLPIKEMGRGAKVGWGRGDFVPLAANVLKVIVDAVY